MIHESSRTAAPTSVPVLRRILAYGGFLAAGIGVVGAVVGGLVAGGPGVASALVGTAVSVVFMGITAASILLANRFAGSQAAIGGFFAIVLGGWLVKFVAFLILVFLLKDQPWIQPVVLFVSIIAGVVGSLLVDVIVVLKSRLSYASDVALPAPVRED